MKNCLMKLNEEEEVENEEIIQFMFRTVHSVSKKRHEHVKHVVHYRSMHARCRDFHSSGYFFLFVSLFNFSISRNVCLSS